ncbi:hypothetical protein [Methanobacterium sp. ACI-7]|uniref:hypothetical protein n=1 Tax=unclassified Methanobacterium TaxID=2627676 RepID=UPI0039C0E22C
MEKQKASGGSLVGFAIIFIILFLLFPVFTVYLFWIAVFVMLIIGLYNILTYK